MTTCCCKKQSFTVCHLCAQSLLSRRTAQNDALFSAISVFDYEVPSKYIKENHFRVVDIYYPQSQEHMLSLISVMSRPNRALQKVRAAGRLRVLSVYVMYFIIPSAARRWQGSGQRCPAQLEQSAHSEHSPLGHSLAYTP